MINDGSCWASCWLMMLDDQKIVHKPAHSTNLLTSWYYQLGYDSFRPSPRVTNQFISGSGATSALEKARGWSQDIQHIICDMSVGGLDLISVLTGYTMLHTYSAGELLKLPMQFSTYWNFTASTYLYISASSLPYCCSMLLSLVSCLFHTQRVLRNRMCFR